MQKMRRSLSLHLASSLFAATGDGGTLATAGDGRGCLSNWRDIPDGSYVALPKSLTICCPTFRSLQAID